jgi:hypothetical protein
MFRRGGFWVRVKRVARYEVVKENGTTTAATVPTPVTSSLQSNVPRRIALREISENQHSYWPRAGRRTGEEDALRVHRAARTVRLALQHYKRGDVHCVMDNASYHSAPSPTGTGKPIPSTGPTVKSCWRCLMCELHDICRETLGGEH